MPSSAAMAGNSATSRRSVAISAGVNTGSAPQIPEPGPRDDQPALRVEGRPLMSYVPEPGPRDEQRALHIGERFALRRRGTPRADLGHRHSPSGDSATGSIA